MYRGWYYIKSNKINIYTYTSNYVNGIENQKSRHSGIYFTKFYNTKIEVLVDIADFINNNV